MSVKPIQLRDLKVGDLIPGGFYPFMRVTNIEPDGVTVEYYRDKIGTAKICPKNYQRFGILKNFNAVYDVLVKYAGADERGRADFIHAHEKDVCTEYRFIGALGWGGKYYSEKSRVSCYSEHETPERLKMIQETNLALKNLTGF